MIEKVALGSSDIQVTRVALGTWNMGGQPGWGPESEAAAVTGTAAVDAP